MTAPTPNTLLIDEVRALSVDAALTDLTPEDTAKAVALLREARQICTPNRERLHRQGFDAPKESLATGNPLWPTGLFNTVYPQIDMHIAEQKATADWTSRPVDEGPPGCVHGGVSAFLMDIMAGVLVQALGYRAVTGTLNMTYRKRVPLEETVQLASEIEQIDGRKIHVLARILVDGEEAVQAKGLFITIQPPVSLDGIAVEPQ